MSALPPEETWWQITQACSTELTNLCVTSRSEENRYLRRIPIKPVSPETPCLLTLSKMSWKLQPDMQVQRQCCLHSLLPFATSSDWISNDFPCCSPAQSDHLFPSPPPLVVDSEKNLWGLILLAVCRLMWITWHAHGAQQGYSSGCSQAGSVADSYAVLSCSLECGPIL